MTLPNVGYVLYGNKHSSSGLKQVYIKTLEKNINI